MGLLKNGKGNKNGPLDDPMGLDTPAPRAAAPKPGKSGKSSYAAAHRHAKRNSNFIRVEELRKAMGDQNLDIDTDSVLSVYIPRRRIKRLGAAIRRLNKLYIALLILLLLLLLIFALSFTQEKMGNFTINLNRIELYRHGISLSDSGDFSKPRARLTADPIPDATNISILDLPQNLDATDGDHSGQNYLAYTFYMRNSGKEDVSYTASVNLNSATKGVENAVRVAVWHNGDGVLYAAPAADGGTEEGCTNFETADTVCTFQEDTFQVGDVDKYTVVIWLEGDDPECVDAIVGGSVQFSMTIDSEDNEEDIGLLRMFIQDIMDMLSGNDPIMASSDMDVPEYYLSNDITWENRRNQ